LDDAIRGKIRVATYGPQRRTSMDLELLLLQLLQLGALILAQCELRMVQAVRIGQALCLVGQPFAPNLSDLAFVLRY
jgi:hypothetical protein